MRVLLTLLTFLFSMNTVADTCDLFKTSRATAKSTYESLANATNPAKYQHLDDMIIKALQIAVIARKQTTVTSSESEAISSASNSADMNGEALLAMVETVSSLAGSLSAHELAAITSDAFLILRKSHLTSNIALIDVMYAAVCSN